MTIVVNYDMDLAYSLVANYIAMARLALRANYRGAGSKYVIRRLAYWAVSTVDKCQRKRKKDQSNWTSFGN